MTFSTGAVWAAFHGATSPPALPPTDPSSTYTGPKGESAKSGPIGLAVILLLCVAAYFLFKSMSRHMKKVREDFPTVGEPQHVQPSAPRADADPEPEPRRARVVQRPPSAGEQPPGDDPPA